MTINKFGISTLALAISLGFASVASAKDDSSSRDVDSFESVSLSGSFDVEIVVGESQSVVLYGDEEDLDEIVTRVRRGELQIYYEDEHRRWRGGDIEVKITVPSLTGFELSGSGSGDISNVNATDFSLEISGSGNLTVDGKCVDLELEISGSGNIDSEELICDTAEVEISGSGNIDVHAASAISAQISGSGDIDVYGHPTRVSLSSSGSGSINVRD